MDDRCEKPSPAKTSLIILKKVPTGHSQFVLCCPECVKDPEQGQLRGESLGQGVILPAMLP